MRLILCSTTAPLAKGASQTTIRKTITTTGLKEWSTQNILLAKLNHILAIKNRMVFMTVRNNMLRLKRKGVVLIAIILEKTQLMTLLTRTPTRTLHAVRIEINSIKLKLQ